MEERAAKKRRLDYELGRATSDLPEEERTSFSLPAQNRALCTQLFSYKRRIAELDAKLQEAAAGRATATDYLAVVNRRLAELEEEMLAAIAQNPGVANGLDLQAREVLERLLGRRAEVGAATGSAAAALAALLAGAAATAAGEESGDDPMSGSSSSTPSALPTSLAALDAGLAARLGFITRALAGAAAVRLAASGPDAALSAEAKALVERVGAALRERAAGAASREAAARAAAAAAAEEACALRAEVSRLDAEARASARTLERIKYDHPSLDVEAHAKSIAPHSGRLEPGAGVGEDGVDTFLAAPAAAAASAPAASAVAGGAASGGVAAASGGATAAPSMGMEDDAAAARCSCAGCGCSGRAASVASGGTAPGASGGSVALPAPQPPAPGPSVAALNEEIESLREEVGVFTSLAQDRAQELDEVRSALAAAQGELHQLRALLPPGSRGVSSSGSGGAVAYGHGLLAEELVLSHPLFMQRAAEHDAAVGAAAAAAAAAAHANAQLGAWVQRAELLEGRLRELTRLDRAAEAGAAAAAAEHRHHLQGVLSQALADRDQALARAAEGAAAAEECKLLRAQVVELQSSLDRVRKELKTVQGEWRARVLAAPAVKEALEAVQAAAGSGGEAAAAAAASAEVASLNAEKEQLTLMIESLSASFEEETQRTAGLMEAARAQSTEHVQTRAALARLATERSVWGTTRATLETQLADANAAAAAATAAAAAASAAVDAARADAAAKDEAIAALQREVASLNGRADQAAAPGTLRDHRTRMEALSRQTAAAMASVAEAQAKLVEAEAARARAAEEAATASKRLLRREEKVAKLKAQVEELEARGGAGGAAATFPSSSQPPLRRSVSAPGSTTAGGAGLDSDEQQQLRMLQDRYMCGLCHHNARDVAITKCGHLWCNACVTKVIKGRSRACPGCGTKFAEADVVRVYVMSA